MYQNNHYSYLKDCLTLAPWAAQQPKVLILFVVHYTMGHAKQGLVNCCFHFSWWQSANNRQLSERQPCLGSLGCTTTNTGNSYWRGRLSKVGPLALSTLDQLLFILEILFTFVHKKLSKLGGKQYLSDGVPWPIWLHIVPYQTLFCKLLLQFLFCW
jgi:hypothetical protein